METVILQHLDLSEGSFGPSGVSSSYLNCIPLSKYREYCEIRKVSLKLESSTHQKILIKMLFIEKSPIIEEFEIDGTASYSLDRGDVIIISSSNPDDIKGVVEATVEKKANIHLEHVVCTYHREQAITEKVDLFTDANLQNYHMTVVDNGSTLDIENNNIVTIINSPNLGGASGFTRGIIEGVKTKKTTHILLNDDDAYIHPESVFRMIQFLSVISPNYYEYSISGVFLDIDSPNIIRETGGLFENGLVKLFNEGKCVDSDDGLLSIVRSDPMNYAAWTCICIPKAVITKINLPLPIFFKFDDIEYGRRLDCKIIPIPGISIWHQTFSTYPLSYCYYTMRNRLVTLSCLNELNPISIDNAFNCILSEIASYRYDCAEEMITGVEDFLKGPDYVFNNCIEGMHKTAPVVLEDLKKLRPTLRPLRQQTKPGKKLRALTLNGLFLPSIGDIELGRCETETIFFYRINKVLYSCDDDRCIQRKRSCHRTINLVISTLLLRKEVKMKARCLNSDYRRTADKYSTIEQWEKLWNCRTKP